jgi:hypothetical protein
MVLPRGRGEELKRAKDHQIEFGQPLKLLGSTGYTDRHNIIEVSNTINEAERT